MQYVLFILILFLLRLGIAVLGTALVGFVMNKISGSASNTGSVPS